MTNNFETYKQFITEKFNNTELQEGDAYFVIELVRRGKDNPDMPAANYHFYDCNYNKTLKLETIYLKPQLYQKKLIYF